MSERTQQLESLELSINESKDAVELANSLERLYGNADFKKLITTGYFVNHAADTVAIRAKPAMQSEMLQRVSLEAISAIGHFREYLAVTAAKGAAAARCIESDEETRAAIYAEGE